MLNLQSENAFTVEEGLVEVMNKQTAEYRNICVDGQNTTITEIKWKLSYNIQRVNSLYNYMYRIKEVNIVFYEIYRKFRFWVYQGEYILTIRKSKMIFDLKFNCYEDIHLYTNL